MTSRTRLPNHAFIVHHVPGRVRLRIPSARDDPEVLGAIASRLGGLPGVTDVQVRPQSASTILSYRPLDRLGSDSLHALRQAAARRGVRIAVDPVLNDGQPDGKASAPADVDGPSRLACEVDRYFDAANRAIKRRTGNLIDLEILVPLITASAATLNVRSNRSTPLWLTLFIFSFNALMSAPSRHGFSDATGRTR